MTPKAQAVLRAHSPKRDSEEEKVLLKSVGSFYLNPLTSTEASNSASTWNQTRDFFFKLEVDLDFKGLKTECHFFFLKVKETVSRIFKSERPTFSLLQN